MPYEWLRDDAAPERSGAVRLRLWPHRSMPRRGYARFIWATAAFSALPLLAVLGSSVLWGLLPFGLLTLWGLMRAIEATYRSGEVAEELRLTPGHVELVRTDPARPARRWAANPHWVRAELHAKGGPVPDYLTLTGAGRTVELGAFLSAEERKALLPEVTRALADAA